MENYPVKEENDLWMRLRKDKKFDRKCEARDDIVRKIDSLWKQVHKRDIELGKIFAKAIKKEIVSTR